MSVYSGKFNIKTRGETDIKNITQQVGEILTNSGIENGIITVFIPGATGGISTIEYESGLIEDIKGAFERIAPRNGRYKHNERWGDGNGFSHVRATFMKPSISLPFNDGEMILGTWQQIIFMDFDNRPRERTIIVQIVGE